MRILHQLLRSTLNTLHVLAAAVWATFKSRAALQLENLALRHQVGVLQRSVKRPKLAPPDRLLWVWLCAVWSGWRSALLIVKPNTVIAWHRRSFRLFWTWKVRRGQPGRPAVPKHVRELIRRRSRENPLWGAPRLHGELLKLGMDVGETSVGKYLVRHPKPPSQTWRTFLEKHVKTMVSVDFFTVPTISSHVILTRTNLNVGAESTATPRAFRTCLIVRVLPFNSKTIDLVAPDLITTGSLAKRG